MNNLKNNAFQFIDDHRQGMLALWQELVNTESGSADKPGIDAVATRIKQVLDQACGVTKTVEMAKAGNMLVGEIGAGRGAAPVLFMGHMDTVFSTGTVAKRPFTITLSLRVLMSPRSV